MKKLKRIFGIVLCILFSISTLVTPFIVGEVELSQKGLFLYRCLAFSIFFLFTLGIAISFNFIPMKKDIAFIKGKFKLAKLWLTIIVMIVVITALLMNQMPKSDKANMAEHAKEEQRIKQAERLAAKEKEAEKLKKTKEQEEEQKQKEKDAAEKKRLAAKEKEAEKLKKMKEQEENQKQKENDLAERKKKESIKQREKAEKKKKDSTIDLLYYNQVYKGDGKTISSKIVKRKYKDHYIVWTGYVKKVNKNSIVMEAGASPEVHCKFDSEKGDLRKKKFKVGDLITIEGKIDKFHEGWLWFKNYWIVDECEIQQTTEKIKDQFFDTLRNPLQKTVDKKNIEEMEFIEINEAGNIAGEYQMQSEDINSIFYGKYVKWTANIINIDNHKLTLNANSHSNIEASFSENYGNLEDMNFEEQDVVTVVGRFEKFHTGFFSSNSYRLDDCYIINTSRQDQENLEYYNQHLKLKAPITNPILADKTYKINKRDDVLDIGRIPEPAIVNLTVNTARFVKRDNGYYLILNVTYHFKTVDEVASIDSFSWTLNGTEGEIVPSENPIYREKISNFPEGYELDYTNEYVQYFPITCLREKDKIQIGVGGFNFDIR